MMMSAQHPVWKFPRVESIETPDKGSIIVNGFDVAKKGKKQKYFKEVVV